MSSVVIQQDSEQGVTVATIGTIPVVGWGIMDKVIYSSCTSSFPDVYRQPKRPRVQQNSPIWWAN